MELDPAIPDTGNVRLLHLTDSPQPATYDSINELEGRNNFTSCSSDHLAQNLDNLCLEPSPSSDEMDWDAVNPPSPSPIDIPIDHAHLPTPKDNQYHAVIKVESKHEKPFHRWVRSLRRRATLRHFPIPECEPRICDPFSPMPPYPIHSFSPGHQKSSSGSSFGFLTTVRSAGVSLSSFGTTTKPGVSLSADVSGAGGSARASLSGNRTSEDSNAAELNLSKSLAMVERSLRRRRILEELIKTEEGYVGDIRFLANMYVTIFASHSSFRAGLKAAINELLAKILQLHESILGELHRVVPHSEYTQMEYKLAQNPEPKSDLDTPKISKHSMYTETFESRALPSKIKETPGMVCEAQVAAEVARLFSKKTSRFLVYKEYSARYETMIEDIASAKDAVLDWKTYQKGLEILAATLSSSSYGSEIANKSLTVADLLIKPIQRVCRYPLLFTELLNCTTEVDCPNSHMEIDAALRRLKEATRDINEAKDNQQVKLTLERTWLLQDRLVFANQKFDATSKTRIRSLGHIQLCGALHICWPSTDGASGQYMICLLYANALCLAYAGKTDLIYTIQACIDLENARVESANSGRGLQCNASFCWKLVFECDCQLYEIVMTACTEREEMEWRTKLSHHEKPDPEYDDAVVISSVELRVPLTGSGSKESGRIVPRITVQRAATLGSKAPSSQVVVKNTCATKNNAAGTSVSAAVNRSQSVLATRVPVLAPPKSERTRLEVLLSDVWTREALPFPGMGPRSRSDNLVRSSASTVMRKLSVASIASSLSKRSGSIKQKHKTLHNMERDRAAKESENKNEGDVAMVASDGTSEDENTSRAKRPKTQCDKPTILIPASPTSVPMQDNPAATIAGSTATMVVGWAPQSWPISGTNLQPSHSVKYKQHLTSPDSDGEYGRRLMRVRARSLRSEANESRREASSHSLRGMFR